MGATHVAHEGLVVLFLVQWAQVNLRSFVEWRIVVREDNTQELDPSNILFVVLDAFEVVIDDSLKACVQENAATEY